MKKAHIFDKRRSGVLLHITSLPSGNLGEDAYRFVDFLQATGATVWQMLPLGPTHSDRSPYQCLSAHAGSNLLICPQLIQAEEWCQTELNLSAPIDDILQQAYQIFEQYADETQQQSLELFCEAEAFWLEDYVLFREIRQQQAAAPWYLWPVCLRARHANTLQEVKSQSAKSLRVRRFEQYLFYLQWRRLRSYANERGISLFGDMPIFVAHDSADVWAEPHLFTLNKEGLPVRVAGVPPDYFSETGQRWGNPLYEWQQHTEQNFDWWHRRLKTQLALFDLLRIDHFRGFEACWEIPADCETAIEGRWVNAPGEQLFDSLLEAFGELPVVAEDLGIITDEVTALRKRYGMPGMKILQFAFGGDASNPYLPHQQCRESVTYTGTHDNNTTLGWYNELDPQVKAHMHAYLGETVEMMPWLLIRTVLQSTSELVVIPLQDLLALDGSHRMNTPGTTEGNWQWQFQWEWIDDSVASRLWQLNDLYGRI